jgi:hypothetical protein
MPPPHLSNTLIVRIVIEIENQATAIHSFIHPTKESNSISQETIPPCVYAIPSRAREHQSLLSCPVSIRKDGHEWLRRTPHHSESSRAKGTIIQGGRAAESHACVKREIWAIQVELLVALGGDLAASRDVFVLRPFTLPVFHCNIDVLAHCGDEGLILTSWELVLVL